SLFQWWTVDGRRVHRRYSSDWGVQFVEDFFLQNRGNLGTHSAERFVFLYHDRAMSFPDGFQDRCLVQRANRTEVQHFCLYFVLSREHFGGFEAGDDRSPVRDQSYISPLPFD